MENKREGGKEKKRKEVTVLSKYGGHRLRQPQGGRREVVSTWDLYECLKTPVVDSEGQTSVRSRYTYESDVTLTGLYDPSVSGSLVRSCQSNTYLWDQGSGRFTLVRLV